MSDHVSDHALRFSTIVVTSLWNECTGFRFADFAHGSWLEKKEYIVENKLIRHPYPNRTLFSKEEQRSEKGGVAQ